MSLFTCESKNSLIKKKKRRKGNILEIHNIDNVCIFKQVRECFRTTDVLNKISQIK